MDSAFAIRRLARDVRAFEQDEETARFISCQQSESDQYTLFCNMCPLTGPYANWNVHMHLTFPHDYPSSPPDVRLLTRLPCHPNVFENYICLDMLKKWAVGPYQGWTAAYDLGGILRQLYSFLLVDDTLEQDYGGIMERRQRIHSAKQPAQARCWCNFERLPKQGQIVQAGDQSSTQPSAAQEQEQLAASHHLPALADASTSAVPELPADMLRTIMEHATAEMRAKCAVSVCGDLGAAAQEVQQMEELRCFYSKNTIRDPNTVLCMPVFVSRHKSRQVSSISITDPSNLLSLDAFMRGHRHSAWNLPVNEVLPVVLNQQHEPRCMAALPQRVASMLGLPSSSTPSHRNLLDIMAKMMNTLVVEVVKSDDGKGRHGTVLPRHMSDVALLSFIHLHHLLITAALSNAAMLADAEATLRLFLSHPEQRAKDKCPDLGMLLILLLLVPRDSVRWSDLGPVFVRELLSRHIRWSAQTLHNSTFPLFSGGARVPRSKGECFVSFDAAKDDGNARLQNHLQTSITSLRIVSLSVWFGNALVRPSSKETMVTDLAAIKAAYDKRNGLPPAYVFGRFNAHAHGVLEIKTWSSFLSTLRLGLRGVALQEKVERLVQVLRQAVLDSHQRGYHKGPAPWVCLDTSHCSTQKDALNLQREAVNALRGSAYKAQNCKAFEAWDPNALPIIAGPEADALW